MKKIVLLLTFSLGIFYSNIIVSQDFITTVGIRSGSYTGFTGRLMYNDRIALQGIIGWRNKGVIMTTLIQKYKPLPYYWSDRFQYYYGFGAHFGSAKTDKNIMGKNHHWDENSKKTVFALGADAILGCEYNFVELPVIVGLEVKPFLEMYDIGNFNLNFFEFSFTIQYKLNIYK
jgi:hypothetical protein